MGIIMESFVNNSFFFEISKIVLFIPIDILTAYGWIKRDSMIELMFQIILKIR